MVKNEEKKFLKFKYALALKSLLENNKKQKEFNLKNGIENLNLDYSYGKISSTTGLRPATISNIISGISEMKIYTLDLILGSLGVSYTEFGKILDKVSQQEILKYKEIKEKERIERVKNKSKRKKINRKK
ncbi:MAG: hypothetical protein ACTHM5_21095 [Ginsengibacter sp.]